MSDTTYDGDDLCPECGGEGFTLEGDTHVATACPRCDGGGTIATHADPTGMAVETRCWTTWEGHRCVLDKDHDGDHDYTEPEPEPRCDAWSIGGDERCLLTVGHTDPHFYSFDLPSETTEAHPVGEDTTWTGVPEGVITAPSIIHPTTYGPITVTDPGTGDVWKGPGYGPISVGDPDDDLAVMSDPHSIASSAVRAHPIGALPEPGTTPPSAAGPTCGPTARRW
jgi:hypothetical protein